MEVSVRMMLVQIAVLVSAAICVEAAGKDYLPPSSGYNYPPPQIPFETNQPPSQVPYPKPNPVPTYGPPSVPTRPPYQPPVPQPQPHGGGEDHHHHHEDHHHEDHHHHEPGMPFDFAYAVKEDGNDYSHNAASDGDVTRGEYRVALPDGRTQIVKYTADWRNGFNAEVTYEGEARYPDQPQGRYSAPSQQYADPSQGGGYKY